MGRSWGIFITFTKTRLLPKTEGVSIACSFGHIFAGGYSAGYYSYIWAAVLDSDAFDAFKQSSDIFNPKLADNYRQFILEAGGTEDPMVLYEKFRGQKPTIDALLEDRGLN